MHHRASSAPKLWSRRSLAVEAYHPCAGGLYVELPQQRHDLPAMVGGMVHRVLQGLEQGVDELSPPGGLDRDLGSERLRGEPAEELAALGFHAVPQLAQLGERAHVTPLEQ